MKVTFISTVLNEEKTINGFLDSIEKQTRLPDEIILVDGGSTDQTIEIINETLNKSKLKNKTKILIKKGNRSTGRNFAIEKAKYELIACSDAGCSLDKNWLKKITKPFEDSAIDVASGFYKPIAKSVFEKSLSTYTCVMPDQVNSEDFLPSSRSVAFKKSAWRKVGGYPEWLSTCEDLYFARELKRAGFKFQFIKNAIVDWPQRRNLFQAFRQFFNYAVGDGLALYIRPNTPFLVGRYVFVFLLFVLIYLTRLQSLIFLTLFLFLAYIGWSILKNYRYIQKPQALIYLPALQFTSDFAVLFGMSVGIARRVLL